MNGSSFVPFDGSMPQGWPDPPERRTQELRSPTRQFPIFNAKVTYDTFRGLLDGSPNSHLIISEDPLPPQPIILFER